MRPETNPRFPGRLRDGVGQGQPARVGGGDPQCQTHTDGQLGHPAIVGVMRRSTADVPYCQGMSDGEGTA